MDRAEIEKQIETVLGRQRNLSPEVEQVVRGKLEELDWEAFTSRVLERYYAAAARREETMSADECNRLLMEAVRHEVGAIFSESKPE